jgi:hypothetical protein
MAGVVWMLNDIESALGIRPLRRLRSQQDQPAERRESGRFHT